MRCSKCGQENPDTNTYCLKCGVINPSAGKVTFYEIESTVLYHEGRLNQMESTFNMSNSYFILAETLIMVAYFSSLISTVHWTIFKFLLVIGLIFSILWILINIQYFEKYIEENNVLAREFTILANQDRWAPEKRTRKEITFWEKWKKDGSFWSFIITPAAFVYFYTILLLI